MALINPRILRAITLLITIFSLSLPAYAKYSGGTGESNDPYLIYTAEQMNSISAEPNDWDKHFRLMADIDMGTVDPNTTKPIGGSASAFFEDSPFTGVFDGGGFVIYNFSCSSLEKDGVGLFGVVWPKAEHLKQGSGIVKNLHLVALEVTGQSCVGGLVGQNCGTVVSCSVAGEVTGWSSVGGLVGENRGVITLCESSTFVLGESDVGGLVGKSYRSPESTIHVVIPFPVITPVIPSPSEDGNDASEQKDEEQEQIKHEGLITSCRSVAHVGGIAAVGGLVGFNSGTIHSCESHGQVLGDGYVGGLVGLNGPAMILDEGRYEITLSYSDADVWGDNDVGGLVGINYDGTVNACYAVGNVLARECAGGLVGSSQITGMGPIGIKSCYATGLVRAEHCAGGLVGANMTAIVTSYSIGAVSGKDNIGGLVGQDFLGGVLLSYWDVQASGVTVSAGGRGRTSEQMRLADTFKGWGHDSQWIIEEGTDYPHLAWEESRGDLIMDDPNRYGGGTGDANDPYQIWTAAQFAEIGRHPADLDKCFSLVADVNLAETDPSILRPIGTVYAPFTGIFEGNGHTVAHFTCSAPSDNFIGMFGNIGCSEEDGNDVGIVQNLGLTCVSVRGHDCVGGLVGTNDGIVRYCAIDGDVTGYDMVGGLAGFIGWAPFNGMISSCYSAGHITGNNGIGGLIGGNSGAISHSYAFATIDGKESVGGFVGHRIVGDMNACFWDVTVSRTADGVGNVGPDPNGVEGFSTTQMRTAKLFLDAGWDFVGETENGTEDNWWIDEGQDYPRLWWELGDESSP